MKGPRIAEAAESRPEWETLEAFARQGIKRLLQHVLQEEVEQLPGCRRYGIDATELTRRD